MNQTETRKLLAMLRAQYQHRFIVDDMTELVWLGLLNDEPALPAEAVYKAAMVWMRDNEWPPQVRDLRDIIASTVGDIPTADEAWQQLCERIRVTYPGIPNDLPRLPDLICDAVQEVGGTRIIRQSEKPEDTRKRFVAAYERRRRVAVQGLDVSGAYAVTDGATAITGGTS